MIHRFFVLVCMAILSPFIVLGQQPNPLDETYTPKGNSPLTREFNPYGSGASSKGEYSYPKHAIKWNISLLGRGAFVLNYEYNLTDYISLNGIAGINFLKDYVMLYYVNYFSIFRLWENENNAKSFNEIYANGELNGMTPYLGLALKFFLSSEQEKALQFDFMRYNHNITYTFSETFNITDSNGSTKTNTQSFTFPVSFKFYYLGVKYIAENIWGSKKICGLGEFYTGLGIRIMRYTPIVQNNNGQIVDYKVGDAITRVFPHYAMGYIFGLGIRKQRK